MPVIAGLHHEIFPDEGEGDVPLVILPGLLADGRRLARLCRDLRGRRSALIVDPLGGGASECPEDDAAYGWDRQVARLFRVLDARSMPLVDVVGLSMGGMWAQHALSARPDRFRKVVLCATCLRTGPRLGSIVQALLAQIAAGVGPVDLMRCLSFLFFSPEFLDRPSAVPLLLSMATEAPLSLPGLAGQLRALLCHDLTGRLSGGERVVGVIAGAEDLLMHRGEQRRLAAALGMSAPTLIAGAGHCLWIEEPRLFSEAVRHALSG